MGTRVDEVLVRKVALLARLELTQPEVEEFTGQLGAILDYMDRINQIDTASVEPLAHCLPLVNRLRDDVPAQSMGAERALANAPQKDGDFFQIPRVLDGDLGS